MRRDDLPGNRRRPLRLGLATSLLLVLLAGGAPAQLVNQATVESDTPSLVNQAAVGASNSLFRFRRVEVFSHVVEVANVTSTVVTSADLAITKTAPSGPITLGAPLTFSISATNNGPSAATDVVIDDPLPASVTFLAATPSPGGSCTTPAVGSTGAVTCIWAGPTQPAEVRTVDIEVQTALTGPALSLDNTATVASSTGDPSPLNDNASATVMLAAAPVVQIPTLGRPGSALLVLGLALAGLFMGRRLLTGA